MDDKDFWEEEYTELDKFQKRKNLSKARSEVITPAFGLSRQSVMNDIIAKALDESPLGWMMTDIKRNAVDFGVSALAKPTMDTEVTIKVFDEGIISKLAEAMRYMQS